MEYADALHLVGAEFVRATREHAPFHSAHEGWAVINEEMDELWEQVRKCKNFKDRHAGMKREAVQVAAMAIRFLVDLGDD